MTAGSWSSEQGLPPVIGADAAVLILGSFPSRQSLETGQYYANPQNRFWTIMEILLGIRRTLPYTERIALLKERRIALWDSIGACRRAGSADNRIREAQPNPVEDLLVSHPHIRFIGCNGSRAATVLLHRPLPADVRFLRLPSTSPANARIPLAEKIRQWSVILEYR